MTKLSIVIPAFNEEKRLPSSIKNIQEHLKGKDYELIVVDDGSKDNTKEIIKDFEKIKLISYEKNMGKGYAVKRGVLESIGDLILITDADLSTPITELEKFLNLTHEAKILIGSRKLKDSEVDQPKNRKVLGKAFNILSQIFIIKGIKDTQCGFKLFNGECARHLFKKQKINGFAFDIEILYLGKKFKYNIKEVPVKWVNDRQTKVNLLTDPFKMMKDLIKVRIFNILGKYD